ncbi:MAG: hypothetical protein JWP61_2180 [Friedmanniella sp.]|nr:hypothetical protein [Friedmanniella sp.]
MSTTQHSPAQSTPPPGTAPEPRARTLDLSVTQIIGGALAAMTAAFLGSRFSLAGTVAGAAMASIVAAVAGTLYTASLRTTREKVRTVFSGRVGPSEGVASDTMPARVDVRSGRGPDELTRAPVQPEAPRTPSVTRTPPSRAREGRSMLVGAVLAFALAAVSITGFELAYGHNLSGGTGTTVARVGGLAPAASTATPKATPEATPSETPSATATPSGTPSAPVAPTPSATPSTGVTPEPSATAGTPSAPAATPSAGAVQTPVG